jgi:hypothetical protein
MVDVYTRKILKSASEVIRRRYQNYKSETQ